VEKKNHFENIFSFANIDFLAKNVSFGLFFAKIVDTKIQGKKNFSNLCFVFDSSKKEFVFEKKFSPTFSMFGKHANFSKK
jgi:hypothetical protein